jgi:hypothetical protein
MVTELGQRPSRTPPHDCGVRGDFRRGIESQESCGQGLYMLVLNTMPSSFSVRNRAAGELRTGGYSWLLLLNTSRFPLLKWKTEGKS